MRPKLLFDRRLIWATLACANATALYLQWTKGGWLFHTDGSIYAHDFIAFWSAGKRVLAGHASLVYDVAAQVAFQTQLIDASKPVVYPFFYPPHFLFTAVPFAELSLISAYLTFLAFTAGTYVLAMRLIARDWAEAVPAALAGGGAYFSLLWVQNGFLTGALLVSGIALVPTRPRLAGVLLGLLTIKPQLGLLIPIALVVGGYWRTIAWAAATFIVLAFSAEFAFGGGIWGTFIQSTREAGTFLETGSIWFKMQTPFGLTLRLFGSTGAYVVQAIAGLIAAWLVLKIWLRPELSHWLKCAVLIPASMFVSPYLFAYDAVPLTAAALMLLRENPRLPWADQLALFLACALPGIRHLLSLGVPLAAGIMIAVVLRQVERGRRQAGQSVATPLLG